MANLNISDQVAATSSSTASSSASTSYSDYDIFINHRGPDVKNTFASYLYRRLLSYGMRAFLDREELEVGHDIFSQIEHAIRGAVVHIAIFSQRYAQSPWCLEELARMVKSGATIIPVFYKVDPSVVRHTEKAGRYAEDLRVLEQKKSYDPVTGEEKPRYGSDTIQNWKKALSCVADLSGFVLGDDDDEGMILENLVERVLKKVPKAPLDVPKYQTGLAEKLQDLENTVLSQRQDDDSVGAKVVAIAGMGGVGKTTLAKYFFNFRKSEYSTSPFLFDVRQSAGTMSLAYLQSKLLRELKQIDIKIESSEEGIGMLRRHLLSCHALIILDDIDHVSQLDALLSIREILSPDSLILTTSRDKGVLKRSGVLESSIYNLKGLNKSHSEELFCSFAFNQLFSPPEFVDLVDRFVRGCDRLPLSLKVFGALVCGQNESFWEEILDRLTKTLDSEIQDKLKISYDSLSLEDRQIFLDIACFFQVERLLLRGGEELFRGEQRATATRIWGMAGLQNLENKCLLEVDRNGIKMHDHIRDLGRDISGVQMPRRLWNATTTDIDVLLEQSSYERTEVRGIAMPGCIYMSSPPTVSQMPWYERWSDELFGNCLRHLVHHTSICGLELVAAEDGYLYRILRRVRSPNLKWLRWYKCPYSCLPSWIPMGNLKVLQVTGNRLKTPWQHKSPVALQLLELNISSPSLKTLWQHESQAPLQLRELNIHAPSFLSFPKSIGQLKYLETIVIADDKRQNGVALKSLPEEFCDLRALKYLYLCRCQEMISLPDSFGKLTNLQFVSLFGASSLQMLPDSFGNLTRLKVLGLSFCRNLTISSSTLGNITALESLDLRYCKNVRELPPQVAHQRSLRDLHMSEANLEVLPSWIGDLSNLERLSLGSDLLEVLPPLYLKNLKHLWVIGAPRVQYLPDHFVPLTQLTFLMIDGCGIEYLPQDLPKMNNLSALYVQNCPLRELPFKKMECFHDDDKCMFGLQKLYLTRTEISEVIFPGGVCSNLRVLCMEDCEKLKQIRGLSGLTKLHCLDISGCVMVEELPNIEMLTCLEELTVSGCKKLKSIPGLVQLRKLRLLNVNECHEILELYGAEHLMLLRRLDARNCPKLRWGEGVVEQMRQRLHEGLQL